MAMFNPEFFCVKEEYVSLLQDYQIKRINELVSDFIQTNIECDTHEIEFCPKCGEAHPKLILGGKSGSSNPKQMLRCKSCNKRFVYDTGSLTYYSHQPSSKWMRFIEMTLDKASMKECAEELYVHESTAFRMRHKLMAFIRMVQKDDTLSGLCEVDETYLHVDRKGLVPASVGEAYFEVFCLTALGKEIMKKYGKAAGMRCSKKIDELNKYIMVSVRTGWQEKKKNRKRGISDQKVCIFTGIERQGNCCDKATNLGKPSQKDIEDFFECLEEGSHVWVDGLHGYTAALEEHNCTYTVCPSTESYSALDHLNNVNSLHSDFKEWIRKYRGVSTIYADRYAGMISFFYNLRGKCLSEKRTSLIRELNRHQMYFYVKDIMTKNIFEAEKDLAVRECMTSMAAQYRRFKAHPMSITEAMAII